MHLQCVALRCAALQFITVQADWPQYRSTHDALYCWIPVARQPALRSRTCAGELCTDSTVGCLPSQGKWLVVH
jgi:hypothetical protein